MQLHLLLLAAFAATAIAAPAPVAEADAVAAPEAIAPPNLPNDIEARQVSQDLTWNADDVPENNRWFQLFDQWYLDNNFGNNRNRWRDYEVQFNRWNRKNNRTLKWCWWGGWGYC